MRRPRLTARSQVIAVAIVGLIFASTANLRRRIERFPWISRWHAQKAEVAARRIWTLHRFGTDLDGVVSMNPAKSIRDSNNQRLYHNALAEKYDRAARHPWLPVAPDPPMPE